MKSKSTDAQANGTIASGQLLDRAASILGSQEVGARGNTRPARSARRGARKPEAPKGSVLTQTIAKTRTNTRTRKNDEPVSFMGNELAGQVHAGGDQAHDGSLAGAGFQEPEVRPEGQDEALSNEGLDNGELENGELENGGASEEKPGEDGRQDSQEDTQEEPDDGLPPIRAIDADGLSFFPVKNEEGEEDAGEDAPDVEPYDEWASNGREEAEERDGTSRRLVVADEDMARAGASAAGEDDDRTQAVQGPADGRPRTDGDAVSGAGPRRRMESSENVETDEVPGEPRPAARGAGQAPGASSTSSTSSTSRASKASRGPSALGDSSASGAADVVPFTLPEDEADAEVDNFSSVAELGAYLKSARERRGVTLAKVSRTLRITEANLEALEAGDTARFISPAYARGFLRTYANFLRIPEDKCLGVYAQLNTTQTYQASVYTPNNAARPRKTSPLWGILASLLIASLVGFGIWYFKILDLVVPSNEDKPQTAAPLPSSTSPQVDRMRLENEKELQRKAEERKAEEERSGASSESVAEEPSGPRIEESPFKSLSLVDAGEREPLPAVVQADSAWSALQGNATIAGQAGLAVEQPTVEETVNEAESLGFPHSDANTVVIVSEGTCWLSATVDKERSTQRTLQTGESVAFRFEERLRLRVGNAGAVRIFFDGEEIERGGMGQVRNLTFPPKERQARAAGESAPALVDAGARGE